jgi:transcriptional regulator with GAF, ATPase, and Fis domain
LLRVLQEKVFERIGGRQLIPCNARLIAATNSDLKQKMLAKEFREDLFYRISAFPLSIPPLRERPIDVVPLARHFLARLGKRRLSISDDALEVMTAYTWPGNARELQNVVERASILSDGLIGPQHLPFGAETPRRPRSLSENERQAIKLALEENHGNRTKTAEQLGISIRSLQYRLKEYGITDRES